jgi:transcriptional regulator GlxA family with amidase domain
VTQLDFTGPHQVFSRLPSTTITVASSKGGMLEADAGLCFANVQKLAEVDRCDLLCVPGGVAVTDVFSDEVFLREVERLAKSARFVTSVCTGSLALAATGLLKGRRAACHWAWKDLLALFPGVTVDTARVVRDGNVITGGGVTAGIDLALTVAVEIFGPEVAQSVQLLLEYAPAPPFNTGRPELAPAAVRSIVDARNATSLPRRRAAVEAMVLRMPS